MDPVRRTLNWAYLKYKDHVPIERGKFRLGKLLHDLVGPTTYTFNGIAFELHPVSVIDEKLIRGVQHDPIVIEELRKQVRPGDYVIDAGANIGLFSLQASPIVGERGRVYAFEPSPREFARLIRNIQLNGFTNIVPIASGLSNAISDMEMHLSMLGNTGQNSFFNIPEEASLARCHVGPLTSFMSESDLRKVSFIKIDVEGAEMAVLGGIEGAMPLLARAVFVVEVSKENLARANASPRDIYAFFERHRYRPRIGLQDRDYYDEVFEPEARRREH